MFIFFSCDWLKAGRWGKRSGKSRRLHSDRSQQLSEPTAWSHRESGWPSFYFNRKSFIFASQSAGTDLLWCFSYTTSSSVSPCHAEEEMTRYRSIPPLSLSEDPLNWWHVNKVSFPLLSKMSKRYLCIPATSVSAERVFSNAGDIVTAQWSTLTPEHVDQLLFQTKQRHSFLC